MTPEYINIWNNFERKKISTFLGNINNQRLPILVETKKKSSFLVN